jgi:hypothetical protein
MVPNRDLAQTPGRHPVARSNRVIVLASADGLFLVGYFSDPLLDLYDPAR